MTYLVHYGQVTLAFLKLEGSELYHEVVSTDSEQEKPGCVVGSLVLLGWE